MELSRPRPSNRTTSAVSLVGARIERSVRKSVGARDVRQLIHHYLAIQLASDTADSRAVFQARSESAAVESGPVFHNRRLVAPNYESSKSEKQLLALAKVFLRGQLCLAMVVGLYLAPEASRSIRQICRRWLPKVRRRDRCGFFSFIQFETVFRLRALSIAASAFSEHRMKQRRSWNASEDASLLTFFTATASRYGRMQRLGMRRAKRRD